MISLAAILRIEIEIFLGALVVIVSYKLLTGRITTHRLLLAKGREVEGAGGFSPSRLQLLVLTLGVSAFLLAQAASSTEMPSGIVLLLAASQSFYLVRKAINLKSKR